MDFSQLFRAQWEDLEPEPYQLFSLTSWHLHQIVFNGDKIVMVLTVNIPVYVQRNYGSFFHKGT